MIQRFEVEHTPNEEYLAELRGSHVLLMRKGPVEGGKIEELLVADIHRDNLRHLVEWIEADKVYVGLAGPLAEQVRAMSKELAMTPQNFVLTAVQSFVQAGG